MILENVNMYTIHKKMADDRYGKLDFFIEGNKIIAINIFEVDIFNYFHEKTYDCEIIIENAIFSHEGEVKISEEYRKIYFDFLEGLSLLRKDNVRLSAELASACYAQMTLFWQSLLIQGKYLHGILFWKYILDITNEWEKKNNKKDIIHKGSIYGYIAFNYLIIGDTHSGFNYLNIALEIDKLLGKACPSLNYPQEAPCNYALKLSSKMNYFIYPLALKVREYLEKNTCKYKAKHHSFNFEDIDDLLFSNIKLLDIKLYFVFIMWSLLDVKNKSISNSSNNNFNKQIKLQSLFSLSLVIDNLLNYFQTERKDVFVYITNKGRIKPIKNITYGLRINKFIETCPLDKKYFDHIIVPLRKLDLDNAFPKILIDGADLGKTELHYLIVSVLLRNFFAHEIKPQKIIIDRFDDIVEIQIYIIIMILKFYSKP